MKVRMRCLMYAAMVIWSVAGFCTQVWAADEVSLPPDGPALCKEDNALLVAEAPSTQQQSAPEGEIQERGILRKGPPVQQIEGAVIQGNRVRALPGYKFVPGSGRSAVLQKGGIGVVVVVSCSCIQCTDPDGRTNTCSTKECGVVIDGGDHVRCGASACPEEPSCSLRTEVPPPSSSPTPARPSLPPGVRPPTSPIIPEKTPSLPPGVRPPTSPITPEKTP